jgi:hypothetical protein
LRVEIGNDNTLPHAAEHPTKIKDGRRFGNAALMIEQIDDLGHDFCLSE